jgi:hypothetical protein
MRILLVEDAVDVRMVLADWLHVGLNGGAETVA